MRHENSDRSSSKRRASAVTAVVAVALLVRSAQPAAAAVGRAVIIPGPAAPLSVAGAFNTSPLQTSAFFPSPAALLPLTAAPALAALVPVTMPSPALAPAVAESAGRAAHLDAVLAETNALRVGLDSGGYSSAATSTQGERLMETILNQDAAHTPAALVDPAPSERATGGGMLTKSAPDQAAEKIESVAGVNLTKRSAPRPKGFFASARRVAVQALNALSLPYKTASAQFTPEQGSDRGEGIPRHEITLTGRVAPGLRVSLELGYVSRTHTTPDWSSDSHKPVMLETSRELRLKAGPDGAYRAQFNTHLQTWLLGEFYLDHVRVVIRKPGLLGIIWHYPLIGAMTRLRPKDIPLSQGTNIEVRSQRHPDTGGDLSGVFHTADGDLPLTTYTDRRSIGFPWTDGASAVNIDIALSQGSSSSETPARGVAPNSKQHGGALVGILLGLAAMTALFTWLHPGFLPVIPPPAKALVGAVAFFGFIIAVLRRSNR